MARAEAAVEAPKAPSRIKKVDRVINLWVAASAGEEAMCVAAKAESTAGDGDVPPPPPPIADADAAEKRRRVAW